MSLNNELVFFWSGNLLNAMLGLCVCVWGSKIRFRKQKKQSAEFAVCVHRHCIRRARKAFNENVLI